MAGDKFSPSSRKPRSDYPGPFSGSRRAKTPDRRTAHAVLVRGLELLSGIFTRTPIFISPPSQRSCSRLSRAPIPPVGGAVRDTLHRRQRRSAFELAARWILATSARTTSAGDAVPNSIEFPETACNAVIRDPSTSRFAQPSFGSFAGASFGMPYMRDVGMMSISSSTLNRPPSSYLKTERFASP